MAVTSFAELESAIGDWLNRNPAAMAFGPADLIPLFEARINRILRVPEMEAMVTTETDEATVALPSDFLQLREVRVDGVAIPSFTPQELRERFRNCNAAPQGYAVVGNALLLQPAPSDIVTVDVTYYQRIPALGEGNTSNWLLANHPDLYLFGSLARANAFLRDDEMAAQWKGTEDEILSEIITAANKQRLPAGPLVMRGQVRE